MRKAVIIVFLILTLCLAKTINVKAFSYPYLYDITSVTMESANTMRIRGWVVVNNNGNAVHNIAPLIELRFVNIKTGKTIMTVGNDAGNTFYANPFNYSITNDFTQLFSGLDNYSELANKSRAQAVRAVLDAGLKMYINNHFEFRVSIPDLLKALGRDGEARIELRLDQMREELYGEYVYGVKINDFDKFDITVPNISILDRSIDAGVKNNLIFKNTVDSVRVVENNAFVQGNAIINLQKFDCDNMEFYIGEGREKNAIYQKDNYSVYERIFLYDQLARINLSIYKTGFSVDKSTCKASPGNVYIGYIPSIWSIPQGPGTTIRPIPCEERACLTSENNISLFCPNSVILYSPVNPTVSFGAGSDGFICEKDCQDEYEQGAKVYSDSTCTIYCREEINYSFFTGTKEVQAGMGLTYPVNITGRRLCVKSRLAGKKYSSTCENWFNNNKYRPNPNITATIQVSDDETDVQGYELIEKEIQENLFQPIAVDIGGGKVRFDAEVEEVTYKATFDFEETCVRKYTGTLGNNPNEVVEGCFNMFFTDLFSEDNKLYNITLNITNTGPYPTNGEAKKFGSIQARCNYRISNPNFIPGNVGFNFRQVSLLNPFPNRLPRYNWRGKENLITYKGNLYDIWLNAASMRAIRQDTVNNPYEKWDLKEGDKSQFLRNSDIFPIEIIDKERR